MSHYDSDSSRRTRVLLAHRKALLDLQRVTLRYQVHNELAELAVARRRAALELVVRASLVCLLFVLAACGGEPFNASTAADAGADVVDLVDAGVLEHDAGADVLEPLQVDAGVLEHDAGAVDASTDAVVDDASSTDAGDARSCVVITGYTCAVSGYPYPARCDTLPCCCATP